MTTAISPSAIQGLARQRLCVTGVTWAVCLFLQSCGEFRRPVEDLREPGFEIVNVFDLGHRGVRTFCFCPATRHLFASFTGADADFGVLREWNISNGQLVNSYSVADGMMFGSLFASRDGQFIVAEAYRYRPGDGGDDKAIVIDTKLGRIRCEFPLAFGMNDVRFDRAGYRFRVDPRVVSSSNNEGAVYDVDGNTIQHFDRNEFSRSRSDRIVCVPPTKETPSDTWGIYISDDHGAGHRLTDDQWNENFVMTDEGKFVAATTWNGEIIVWRCSDAKEVFRQKLAQQYGGYLAYDRAGDRFLIGDEHDDGTTLLRALEIDRRSVR